MIVQIVRNPRQAVWHLRKGGPPQLMRWLQRLNAETEQRRRGEARGSEGHWVGRGKQKRLTFGDYATPERAPRRVDLRVAVIADDFSAMAFGFEWDTVPLTPSNWAAQLASQNFDLLFVESVWHGAGGSWRGKIALTPHDSGPLRELVTAFKAVGVPTVFWNKEDPPHYADFLSAAQLFDRVYTTDANMVPEYQRDLGHNRVAVLAFAAQPVVHNPIRPPHGWHARDVAFAGMFFSHKYPQRRAQLEWLLRGASEAGTAINLEIFSRYLGDDEKYQFPKPYADRVVGSLSYPKMLTAYSAYKVFLNVNSVTDSPTMCSRRIFEVIAAGSTLISAPSAAIGAYFAADEIQVVENSQEAEAVMAATIANPRYAGVALHRGQRRIWREHTYSHRAEEVIRATLPGQAISVELPAVSVLVPTRRPHQLEQIFANVGRQTHRDVELIVLSHGYDIDRDEFRRLAEKYRVQNSSSISANASVSLGQCLNELLARASSAVVAKMDDDDYYGTFYLEDQLSARNFSGADIVGKQAHYMYLESLDASILRFAHREHRFTNMVMGPTLVASTELLQELRFANLHSGEDSDLLRRAVGKGATVYSSDRFNFYQHRSAAGHTWSASDHALLATGEFLFRGRPDFEVSI